MKNRQRRIKQEVGMKKIMGSLIGFLLIIYSFGMASSAPVTPGNGEYFIGMDSKAFLERVKELNPNNYVVAYYLGQVYIKEGNRDKGITEWERYLAIAPQDSKFMAVREQLTILKLNQAAEYARNAMKEGASKPDQIKKNTVAVFNFKNKGSFRYNPVAKGLTAMVITDLSKVPGLIVVEREKMQALLQEMHMSHTGIIDGETAIKAGGMLLAKNIIWGEFVDPNVKKIKISSTITETLSSTDLGAPEVEGLLFEFFNLEKKLVFKILKTLGLKAEDLDPSIKESINRIPTRDFDAFLSYAQGLDYLDQKKFIEANKAFYRAVELDPEFDMANNALMSNPENLSLGDDTEQIHFLEFAEEISDQKTDIDTAYEESILKLMPYTIIDTALDQLIQDAKKNVSLGKAEIKW